MCVCLLFYYVCIGTRHTKTETKETVMREEKVEGENEIKELVEGP